MAGLPGLDGQRRRAPRTQVFHPLPPSLVQYAPLLLLCPRCGVRCCATVDRVLLWHEVMKGDRSGERYECTGVGDLGLDAPEGRAA
jgi:hypothetical protein